MGFVFMTTIMDYFTIHNLLSAKLLVTICSATGCNRLQPVLKNRLPFNTLL